MSTESNKLIMDKKFPTKLTKLSGLLSERPEAPLTNMVYFSTDQPDSPVSFWDGSTWVDGGGDKEHDHDDLYAPIDHSHTELEQIVIGGNNTSIGLHKDSLNSITSGADNVAIGANAGGKITTTHDNVAVGSGAAEGASGTRFISVGRWSLKGYGRLAGYASTGAVGIGYEALRSTYKYASVAVGYQALKNSTDGFSNALGYKALASCTSGYGNLALGYNAAEKMTTGSSNIALGHQAMQNNVTGSYNVGIGGGTLGSTVNTSSSKNIAIGHQTMMFATTARENVAMGYNSLVRNKTGYGNVAIGSESQAMAVASNVNTSVGWKAMKDCKGSGNTAVGALALNVAGSCSSNTAIGAYAMEKNTYGSSNTALGQMAGYHNLTGVSNTSLGKGAMVSNYTGSYNTCIGEGSKLPSSNGSYYFVLGSSNTSNLRCNDTSISSLSDRRDKKGVIDCPYGLDYINKLRPVEFEWNYRKEHYSERDGELVAPIKQGRKDVGFIAQELKEVQDGYSADSINSYQHYPVELDSEGKPLEGELGIDVLEADYGKLLPVAIQAIKDLSAKVDLLERKIAALKNQL